MLSYCADVLNIIDTSSDEDADDGEKSSKDRSLNSSLKKVNINYNLVVAFADNCIDY